jgi:hypothetical protein
VTKTLELSPVQPAFTLAELRSAIEPARDRLLKHPLYQAVNTLPRLRVFMAHHVYAVWDFMCLAKRLQRDFTSMDHLWLPPGSSSLARFINGVIHSEESDIDMQGNAASHFELYLAAMEEVRASTEPARTFIRQLRAGVGLEDSLTSAEAPVAVREFVRQTIWTARRGTSVQVLASFLFGREDLIPEMFARFLVEWSSSRQAAGFAYYVKRHIDLDGDDHGPAGLRALAELADRNPANWEVARTAALHAIESRIALWDGIYPHVLRT